MLCFCEANGIYSENMKLLMYTQVGAVLYTLFQVLLCFFLLIVVQVFVCLFFFGEETCTFHFRVFFVCLFFLFFLFCFNSLSLTACFQIETCFLSTLEHPEGHWKCYLWLSWQFLLLIWWLPVLSLLQCVLESLCVPRFFSSFPCLCQPEQNCPVYSNYKIIKTYIHPCSAERFPDESKSHP